MLAVPYDTPVIGYHTDNVATLRLWQCEAEQELDFDAFNSQDYERALTEKNRAEDITRVLYPNDSTVEGKRLRIKQQYFLSSASLQDILRTYKSSGNGDLQRLGLGIVLMHTEEHEKALTDLSVHRPVYLDRGGSDSCNNCSHILISVSCN